MDTPAPFEPEIVTDPITLFSRWFEAATATEPNDPNAMSLATSTADGRPSVRMVLMKRFDDRGFAFYTNAESRKGRELLANPHAALLFHWKSSRRQIRIEGPITELPPADADAYFHSRGRRSQIGAVASQQSRPLASREELLERARQIEQQYPGEIPRPPHWKGFLLTPDAIEFWEDGEHRLHNRVVFTRTQAAQTQAAQTQDAWTRTRLYP